jgi:predicted deacylase
MTRQGLAILLGCAISLGGCLTPVNQSKPLAESGSQPTDAKAQTPHASSPKGGGTAGGQISSSVIGKSTNGAEISSTTFGTGADPVLFIAATHGDEPKSNELAVRFESYLRDHPEVWKGKPVIVVDCANPDGLASKTRQNARMVDLNRNFPTKDWLKGPGSGRYYRGSEPGSEVETKVMIAFLLASKPCRIVSIHCPYRQVNYDGPARDLALAMAAHNHYAVTDYIGYPTTGSLGDWAGKERNIPVVTLELSDASIDTLWDENLQALLAAISYR